MVSRGRSTGLRRPALTRRPTSAAQADPLAAPPVDVSQNVKQVLEVVALVVAPTTLVTALVYWFGLELVDARSRYFGLDPGTLGFSTTDYLIRGVEAGIVPLIVLFLVVLLVTGVHTVATHLVDRWVETPLLRPTVWVVGAAGTAVALVGTFATFRPLPTPLRWYLLPPLLLGAGPLVAAYAMWLLRRLRNMEKTPTAVHIRIAGIAVVALVLLSLFWGMSLYAHALGRGRAQLLGDNLRAQPRVTLYSERSLGIDPSVAVSDRLPDKDARYSHRYSGLRLLVRSNNRYFLLPDNWNPSTGTVLVIPDEPEIRLELSPGG
jgi:hypothetical protein